jgi:ferritin-like metal-binding protein YciE
VGGSGGQGSPTDEKEDAVPVADSAQLFLEGEEFLKENGDSDDRLVDLFLSGAALRVEHYEIAAYDAALRRGEVAAGAPSRQRP